MLLRTISDDHRRRLLVQRHGLAVADRASRGPFEVAETIALLHSTDPVTPYLSMHARSETSVGAIDRLFYEDRALIRHTTLRRTVFAMPLGVFPLAHGSFNHLVVARLRANLVGWIDAAADSATNPEAFLSDVERQVIEALSDSMMTGTQLAKVVPDLTFRIDPAPGASYSKPIRITSKVLELLAADGRIARGRPTGSDFTSGSWRWAVASDWLGDDHEPPLDPHDALTGLLERYLATFAPATVTDISWWSGITKTRIRAALTEICAVEVRLDGDAEPGYVLPDDTLDVDEGLVGNVSLLPGLDSTTMGWKQRSWYVDDRPSTGIFDRNGNAGPTVWLDGRVVGVWTQKRDGAIVSRLFTDLDGKTDTSLRDEIERMQEWLGDVRINWRYPTPITKALV